MNEGYDNNRTGIISRNERKELDWHPDIKGQCEIDGVEYWIDGRKRERKDGTGSFYSLKFTPKNEAPKAAPKPAGKAELPDDDIPF